MDHEESLILRMPGRPWPGVSVLEHAKRKMKHLKMPPYFSSLLSSSKLVRLSYCRLLEVGKDEMVGGGRFLHDEQNCVSGSTTALGPLHTHHAAGRREPRDERQDWFSRANVTKRTGRLMLGNGK